MSRAGTIKMTAEQFLQLGEDPVGVRLELVDGEVAVSPSPIPSHANVVVELIALLVPHVRRRKLGKVFYDVDTVFGKHDVRRPDLLFFAADRLHLVGDTAMQGPPDLCVEVISPASTRIDRRDKFVQYQAGKVAHYWIIDPWEHTFEAFRLVDGRYRPCGAGKDRDVVKVPPFPNLEIPLGDLWLPSRPKRNGRVTPPRNPAPPRRRQRPPDA